MNRFEAAKLGGNGKFYLERWKVLNANTSDDVQSPGIRFLAHSGASCPQNMSR